MRGKVEGKPLPALRATLSRGEGKPLPALRVTLSKGEGKPLPALRATLSKGEGIAELGEDMKDYGFIKKHGGNI